MKHLLILQLVIVNLVGAAGIVAAWPYVVIVLESDTSRISLVIIALWAAMLIFGFIRAAKVSRMLDQSKLTLDAETYIEALHRSRKGGAKMNHLRKGSEWCAGLGMFGTVVGLIILARSIGEITADNVAATIAGAMGGFSVALGTTAVGFVCALWLEINTLFVDTATQCLEVDMAR